MLKSWTEEIAGLSTIIKINAGDIRVVVARNSLLPSVNT
jgi:hypothetical protein